MTTWWAPLIKAIDYGDLDEVKNLISTHDLSHLVDWPSNDMNYSASDLLSHAISNNHTEIAQELLKCDIPVNEPSKYGFVSPLYTAIWKENIKIVDIILEKNGDVFLKCKYESPLEVAVFKKNFRIAERLLNHVGYLNSAPNCVRRTYGSQSAFGAFAAQSDDLFELFLSRGSEISINTTEKSELLNLACQRERPSMIKLLVKYGTDIDAKTSGITVLENIVEDGNLVIIKCILEFCPDMNRNMRIFHQVFKDRKDYRRNETIDVLLRYGFTVRPEDKIHGELLKAAIKQGHSDIIESVLKCEADFKASCKCLQGSQSAFIGCSRQYDELSDLFLSEGSKIPINTTEKSELLNLACKFERPSIVKLLVKYGTDIDGKTNGITALQTAAEEGNLAIIKCILEFCPDINRNIPIFHQVFEDVMIYYRIETIDVLLRYGFTVRPEDKIHGDSLKAAIDQGHSDIIESVLKCEADFKASCKCLQESQSAFTAYLRQYYKLSDLFLSEGSKIPINTVEKSKLLNFACRLERPSIVKLLLKYGTDIDGKTNGVTALQTAVKGNNLATVECILEFCPDININMRIFHRALACKYYNSSNKIVDVLLRYGFTVRPEDTIDGELLKTAIEWGRMDLFKAVLNYRVDVNASCECLRGSTFLHVAAENQRFEISKILIEHGADVNLKNKNGIPPINTAVSKLNLDITRLFLSSGAVIENMFGLLSTAFQIHGTKMVQFLLQYNTKFDINAISPTGQTLLLTIIDPNEFYGSFATSNSLEFRESPDIAEMVEFFLRKGAIADRKSTDGNTALRAAIHRDSSLVIQKLLNYGADVDDISVHENITPLMIAVRHSRLSVVQKLINFLPDSEIRDSRGKTALHHAAKYASPRIVQELLDYGADINATSDDNATPYSCDDTTAHNRAVLEQHMHKMKALNLYVNSKNLERFNLQRGLYDDCKREIEEMKHAKISNSVVSFYDVLTNETQNLVNYVRNQNILSALNKTDEYKKRFPIYSAMMHRRFLKSIRLESLFTPCAQSLNALIGFELPYLASVQLLGLLSIKDLKNLLKASTATD